MAHVSKDSADNASLEDLLLQSAALSVKLQLRYAQVKSEPGARYYTYVLLLKQDAIYVGSSDNIYMRLVQHLMGSGQSAMWVREKGPVVRVIEIMRNCTAEDETYKTLQFMDMFGYERVRGAGWCKVELRSPPVALENFRNVRTNFEHLSRHEIDDVLSAATTLSKQMHNQL